MNNFFYQVAILNSPLELLIYHFHKKLDTGQLVEISLASRKKNYLGVIIKEVEKTEFETKPILQTFNKYYSIFMIEVAKFISQYYVSSIGEALNLFQPYNKLLSTNYSSSDKHNFALPKLSEIQNQAYEFCKNNLTSLLFGVTGSGKTEVYIHLIKDILLKDKQALILMPEIALTSQIENRLKRTFGNIIGVWHSKVTKKTKDKILEEIQTKKIRLVIGARSALFLPFVELGIIIVDEEHDNSYKSEQKPRVNVKDLAIYISKKYDIKVILGSATPSVNSFYKLSYFELKQTYHKTQKKIFFDNSPLGLNNLIINKINSTLNNKNQIIIFLPTRANFKYQICSFCGKAVECPFCSVSMSLYKNEKYLKCHYCGYTEKIPQICPNCKNGVVKNYRLGTEELKLQLSEIFKDKKIKIFDRKNITTTKKLNQILKDFNENKIDILIGTQMLSKGHDYHNVRLSVIMGIDSILLQNSYRAKEQALALAIQIAGRSGRSGIGEVIIQTKNDFFFKTYLDNYKQFLQEELNIRKDLYPPFKKLARIIFSHKNHLKAKEELNKALKHVKKFKIDLIGAKEADIFKLNGKYRYEMLLRSNHVKDLIIFLHFIKSQIVSIDMDTLR